MSPVITSSDDFKLQNSRAISQLAVRRVVFLNETAQFVLYNLPAVFTFPFGGNTRKETADVHIDNLID